MIRNALTKLKDWWKSRPWQFRWFVYLIVAMGVITFGWNVIKEVATAMGFMG